MNLKLFGRIRNILLYIKYYKRSERNSLQGELTYQVHENLTVKSKSIIDQDIFVTSFLKDLYCFHFLKFQTQLKCVYVLVIFKCLFDACCEFYSHCAPCQLLHSKKSYYFILYNQYSYRNLRFFNIVEKHANEDVAQMETYRFQE